MSAHSVGSVRREEAELRLGRGRWQKTQKKFLRQPIWFVKTILSNNLTKQSEGWARRGPRAGRVRGRRRIQRRWVVPFELYSWNGVATGLDRVLPSPKKPRQGLLGRGPDADEPEASFRPVEVQRVDTGY